MTTTMHFSLVQSHYYVNVGGDVWSVVLTAESMLPGEKTYSVSIQPSRINAVSVIVSHRKSGFPELATALDFARDWLAENA